MRFRFDLVLDVDVGFPKPREVGGALRRLVSTEVRPRSEMMLMLLMISSRRDYDGGQFWDKIGGICSVNTTGG